MATPSSTALRWALLAMALTVALVIGSGAFSSTPTTIAERAAALDTRLKAPDSQGLSVGESNSAAAAAVKRQVRLEVNQGKSDDEIVASLEARYGTAVLLTPPGGGLSVLLWIVPALLLLGIVGTVVLALRHRRLGGQSGV